MSMSSGFPASLLLMTALASGCAGQAPLSEPGAHTVLSADGVPIAYEVQGRGPVTLVLVHGWSCDRGYWRDQIEAFRADYRVVALDLAGHGRSGTGRTDWSIANFAADVAAVIAAVDARDAVVIGHSMGGPVAVETGALLPDRVRGVIGVDTMYDFYGTPVMDQSVARLRADFAPATRQFVRGSMFLPGSPPALADGIAAAMATANPAIALPMLDGLGGWFNERMPAAVAAVPAPIGFLMAGGGGKQLQRFRAARGERRVAGVDEIAEAGHFPQLEVPAIFNERLRAMLDRILASGQGN
ncbi:MAG: alpha/beta hydrolase [Gammaproteobacteria bacterium]|nr:MAG: alpha/beta hydrolase [Gammaproteobacteria bacterium]